MFTNLNQQPLTEIVETGFQKKLLKLFVQWLEGEEVEVSNSCYCFFELEKQSYYGCVVLIQSIMYYCSSKKVLN